LDTKETKIPEKVIQILGVGATGSYLAYLCAQESDIFKSSLVIWEGDKIEPHNIRVSIYNENCIGDPKLDTLKDILKTKNDTDISNTNGFWKYGKGLHHCNFLILAVDDILLRKKIVKQYAAQFPDDVSTVIIDPRLASDEIQILTFKIPHIEQYINEWIFDPEEVYKPEEGSSCRILKTPPHLSMRLACQIYDVIHKQSKSDCYVNNLEFKIFD
jgi:hypothetical protein